MDPNATLDMIYSAIDDLAAAIATADRESATDALVRLGASSTHLDCWLAHGGFLPEPVGPVPFVVAIA